MDFVVTGFITSIISAVLLYALFSHEEKSGRRFLGRIRAHADVAVLRFSRLLYSTIRFIVRDLVRQFGRYAYHQVLRMTLTLTRRCEDILRSAIQTNRTLAQSQEEDRETRSKLEEVAYHKATVALSEEEQRQHKDKMLQGL